MAGIRSTKIYEIFKRLIKFDKKIGIQKNGIDNLYPERVDRFFNNSVTAKTSGTIMASYLAGKGWGEVNNKVIVHKENRNTLLDYTIAFAKCLSKQRGSFIEVQYDGNFDISSYDILPFNHCRLGKKDDNDYNGKIIVYDNFAAEDGKIDQKDFKVVDVFNDDKKVIESQVKAAGGFDSYKGQILFVNLDPEYFYPLSQIDPVMGDCDSEAQASIFKNRSLRKGFFGKTMIITEPLVDNLQENSTEQQIAEHRKAESERDNFKKTIESFLGADEAGGVLHVELDKVGDSFDEVIKVENITSNINDKIFAHTEQTIFQNILMAFNNIPLGLVRSDNAIFSSSGEALKIMKETYQENTAKERSILIETTQFLNSKSSEKVENLQFEPLIGEAQVTRTEDIEPGTTSEEDSERKKAQAQLKGSVGGVTALLEIQQSVKDGKTDRESAIVIIEEIFGIKRDLAEKMLGEVKEGNDTTSD